MTKITGVSSAGATQAKPELNFSNFHPSDITMFRDGGTIKLNGEVNRSVNAQVRMDGAMNSKTRGKFYVTEQFFGSKKPAAERAMTKTELKQLKTSLTHFLSTARLDKATGQVYSQFMERLDDALAPAKPAATKVTAATTAKLLKDTNAALAKGSLKFKAGGMPLGQQFVRVPLFSEKHPDGFSYTALIPVGALAPGVKPGDPNKAASFYVERTGGIAGMTMVGGPLTLK